MVWRGIAVMAMLALLATPARASEKPFGLWLQEFTARAASEGVPAALVARALADIEPDATVIRLDRKQPESKLSFSQYRKNTVNPRRIARGRELLREHAALLKQVSQHYGVEPHYIMALWGMETDYGRHTGNFSVIQSLATLAYDGRRAELFTNELLDALKILQEGKLQPHDLFGSWAGAMGNCQFMPSSYRKFAADWDRDGKADIWHSLPDSFASIANYLSQSGWQKGLGWGTPSTADDAIYPGTKEEGGWRTTGNYDVIMKWNRSRYFATSVGLLADALEQ